MYKFYFLLFFALIISTKGSFSQGVWTQKANFPALARSGAVAFSIGNKGYIGTGSGYSDFWEYDPLSDTWSQKADFGGGGRDEAAGFSIGNKGYIGTGSFREDFWEWDQGTNIWSKKANFRNQDTGTTGVNSAAAFSIGNKGYVGTGYSGERTDEFWEYDPALDLWIQKTDFPGGERSYAVGFSIGNKGYIGTGMGNFLLSNDFWEWNQDSDSWTQKANVPGHLRYQAFGISVGNKGLVGSGKNSTNSIISTDIHWLWDQNTNTWLEISSFQNSKRFGAVAFSIGNVVYVGTGHDGNSYLKDLWQFNQINLSFLNGADICANSCNGYATAIVSEGNPPYTFQWNTNPPQNTATATGLCPGEYKVTVTDAIVSIVDSITINPIHAPQSPGLCLVTVDEESKNNIIIWNKTSLSGILAFRIYREISTNNYQPLADVPFDSLSLFVDTQRVLYFPNSGNPNAGSYRYKIKAIDTCGNLSSFSPFHNSIFITHNNGTFFWPQPYTIENSSGIVDSYVLMRDNYSNGNWQPVNSVSGYQQSITDPDYNSWKNTARWRVETQWNLSCTPVLKTGAYTASYSNIYGNTTVAVKENSLHNEQVKVFPIASNGNYQISFPHAPEATQKEIKIYNTAGEIVYQTTCSGTLARLDLIQQAPGLYFYMISLNGFNKTGKLIKN